MMRNAQGTLTAGCGQQQQAPMLLFRAQALDAFRIDEKLAGEGAFSKVLKATDCRGTVWALKLIHLDHTQPTATATWPSQEVYMHKCLAHEPCIVPLQDAFRTQVRNGARVMDFAVLQMPLMQCNLTQHMTHGKEAALGVASCMQPCGSLPVTTVQSMFLQMVNAVRKCHEHGIVHRDIKLENFLVAPDGRLLLCDFGLAASIASPGSQQTLTNGVHAGQNSCQQGGTAKQSGTCSQGGTCWTMSPGRLRCMDEGTAADWWSLGVVLYQLCTGGAWPFKSAWTAAERQDAASVQRAIREAVTTAYVHYTDGIPKEACEVISGLLHPDPGQRWALDQILTCAYTSETTLLQVAGDHPQLQAHMHQLLGRRLELLKAQDRCQQEQQQQQHGTMSPFRHLPNIGHRPWIGVSKEGAGELSTSLMANSADSCLDVAEVGIALHKPSLLDVCKAAAAAASLHPAGRGSALMQSWQDPEHRDQEQAGGPEVRVSLVAAPDSSCTEAEGDAFGAAQDVHEGRAVQKTGFMVSLRRVLFFGCGSCFDDASQDGRYVHM